MIFEFTNSGFDLLKESRDDVYVKIWKRIRRETYEGMQQPTPIGAMLGFEICLEIRIEGIKSPDHQFQIMKDGKIILSDTTDHLGRVIIDLEEDCDYELQV